MESLTFIVAGNIHPNSLQAVPIYAQHGKVIIACEKKDRFDLLSQYPFDVSAHIVISDPLDATLKSQAVQKVFQHYLTDHDFMDVLHMVLCALPYVTTSHVIIVRSEEFYTDWTGFVDRMRKKPFSMITNNFNCQHISAYPYILSTHVIAGKTDMISNAFNTAYDVLCKQTQTQLEHFVLQGSMMLQELVDYMQIICISFLSSNHLSLPQNREGILQCLSQWFDIVSMDVMGMVAYNLESYADPRMSTNADVHQDPGRLERVLESIDDMKKNISNSHLYKMMITAKKFADSEDWYQLMEIAHELKTIQSPALLKDFMNASINTENVEAANEFWNLLIQMMPEKK